MCEIAIRCQLLSSPQCVEYLRLVYCCGPLKSSAQLAAEMHDFDISQALSESINYRFEKSETHLSSMHGEYTNMSQQQFLRYQHIFTFISI